MSKNEYLSVREISQLTEQSTRNVRRIIQKLEGDVAKELLHLDNNNHWKIHNLILGKFKPQRIRSNKYYALSVDPCNNYSESDIDEIFAALDEANPAILEKVLEGIYEISYPNDEDGEDPISPTAKGKK
jgi:hypothetical protein